MPDKADSADKAGVDDIMSPGDMKPILAIARRGKPVSCVVALTADKDGVIMLDRKVKPKRLAGRLKRQCAEAGLEISMTSLRFGHAAVDRDENAGLVTITVHKEPPGGLRLCLLTRLRKAGFREVELLVDAGLEDEEEGDENGDDDGASPLGVPGDLARNFADLMGRIPAVARRAPGQKSALVALAHAAGKLIKASDAQGAASAVKALRDRLDEAASGGRDVAGPDAAMLAKLGAAYDGLRQQIQGDLDALVKRLADTYREFGIADELVAHFRSQISFLDRLDGGLIAKLQEAAADKDQTRRIGLVSQCLEMVTRLQSLIASDPQIRQLDRNPLLPLRIEQTATHTLDVLQRSLSKMTATS